MKKNIGNVDRIVRILAAVAVAALILAGTITGTLAVILGIVAGVLLVTAFVSVCPLYMLLGISSRKSPQAE